MEDRLKEVKKERALGYHLNRDSIAALMASDTDKSVLTPSRLVRTAIANLLS